MHLNFTRAADAFVGALAFRVHTSATHYFLRSWHPSTSSRCHPACSRYSPAAARNMNDLPPNQGYDAVISAIATAYSRYGDVLERAMATLIMIERGDNRSIAAATKLRAKSRLPWRFDALLPRSRTTYPRLGCKVNWDSQLIRWISRCIVE